MALYIIRAGSEGEREDFALENNVAAAGWPRCPYDLSTIYSRDELRDLLDRVYDDETPGARRNWLGQLCLFLFEMKPGDLAAIPLKKRLFVAIGEISSDYYYEKDNPLGCCHLRKVKGWKEIPRSAFDSDLHKAFKAPVTIRLIKQCRAEERVREMLKKTKAT
jgi:restriction system protein